LRRRAAARGLDVIMIEHRGVGLSRHDDAGQDLPPEALTVEQAVDDIVAVLDDARVDSAIGYGTSYGTYLAAGFGVRHPGRVHAMVLDSPVLSAGDITPVRQAIRRVLWDGGAPDTADLAPKIRQLVGAGVLTPVAGQLLAALYGLVGPAALRRQLDLLLAGKQVLWTVLSLGTRHIFGRRTPFHHEPDLVGRIGYRELNYGALPDGEPLDPAVAFREFARDATEFDREPFDLAAAMPHFGWPTVVISGGRDLITPPAVAHRIASLIPAAVLVELPTAGHSALDVRERAALDVMAAVSNGEIAALPGRAGRLDRVPGGLGVRLLVGTLRAAAIAESAVPRVRRRAATS
jgi:pimeloyl-ACP methyl ester carboxylesterase